MSRHHAEELRPPVAVRGGSFCARTRSIRRGWKRSLAICASAWTERSAARRLNILGPCSGQFACMRAAVVASARASGGRCAALVQVIAEEPLPQLCKGRCAACLSPTGAQRLQLEAFALSGAHRPLWHAAHGVHWLSIGSVCAKCTFLACIVVQPALSRSLRGLPRSRLACCCRHCCARAP